MAHIVLAHKHNRAVTLALGDRVDKCKAEFERAMESVDQAALDYWGAHLAEASSAYQAMMDNAVTSWRG